MKAAYEQICKDFPAEKISSSDNIYTWTSGGKTYFATLEDLQTTAQSAPDPSKPTENQNKLTMYDAENISTKIEQNKEHLFSWMILADRKQSGLKIHLQLIP